MSSATSNYLEALACLPAGGMITLRDVPWAEYEQLLEDLGEAGSVRVSYNRGKLNLMTLSPKHEIFKDLVLRIVAAISWEMDIPVESLGSTTFRQEEEEKGAEPDTSFYVQNAARIIGKTKIDLAVDPPPDVVVEIDIAHEDSGKFEIYATMRVPEFWRYDERRLQIFHLTGGAYIEASASLAFPFLTSAVMTQTLEQSKTQGQAAALRTFREWLRQHRLV